MTDCTADARLQRSKADVSFSSTADSTDDVSSTQSSKSGNIKVVCRFRPINERERTLNLGLCVEFPPDPKQVCINATSEPTNGPLKFSFDYVFPPGTEQALVYEAAAKPIVESVLEGFNGTVFAYGQTGSGKTFTMTGVVDDDRLRGITPRMIDTVFAAISASSEHMEFAVKVSYCEIYLEKIKDLLNPVKNNLKVHEDKNRGVFIADLTEEYVSSAEDVANLMRVGSQNREVAFTLMNEGSSRSHSLFLLTITQNNTVDYSAKTGKLYLVDLAGSEKVGKTGAEGKRLDEAKNINKSLSTLGQVITALTDGKSTHVPYRDSKLTRVLQDSLGGNSKTSLIITASPSAFNEPETISTLRFGVRAKSIKNKPMVNKEYTVAELKLLLSKAELEIGKKVLRIQLLEAALLESGAKVPIEESSELLEDGEKRLEKSDMSIHSGEIEDLLQEMEELKVKLGEKEGKLNETTTKLQESDKRVNEMLAQREKMQFEFTRLLDTIHLLDEEKSALEDQLRCVSDLYTNSVSKLSELAQDKHTLERQTTALQQQLDSLEAINETRCNLAIYADEQRDEAEKQVKELTEKLEIWENALSTILAVSSQPEVVEIVGGLKSQGLTDYMGIKQILGIEKTKSERLASELHMTHEHYENLLQKQAFDYQTQLNLTKTEIAETLQKAFELEKGTLLHELEYERINYRNLDSARTEEINTLREKVAALERNVDELSTAKADYNSENSKQPSRDESLGELPTGEKTPVLAAEQLEQERHQRFLARAGGTKIKKMIKGGKGQKQRLMGMLSPFTSIAKSVSKKGDEEEKSGRTLFQSSLQ